MSQRGYAIAFLVVLLVGCLGAFFGGRVLWQRLQASAAASSAWSPPDEAVATDPALATPVPQASVTPGGAGGATPPAVIQVTLTRLVIPTPIVPTIDLSTPTPDVMATLLAETPTPAITMTAMAKATLDAGNFLFVLSSPVRNSTGDCPVGNYILGRVVDVAGNPLPNVRLLLVDEYGNQDNKVTKSEAADAGRYDFPIGGPPRRFYLTVVDSNGTALSARVEIPHELGAAEGATCHWADWRQR